jgi:alpha-glucosidase (family GH31 glycosyl hydrolase)
MIRNLVFLTILFLFSMCSRSTWNTTDNGVVIRLKGDKSDNIRKIRLDVVNDNIIHVAASPCNSFSREKSLVLSGDIMPLPGFNARQEINTLVVSTPSIKARVDLGSGRIIFTDASDNIILSEKEGGKRIPSVTIDGFEGFLTGQDFESSEGDSFYGLGQQQTDDFDYSEYYFIHGKSMDEVISGYRTLTGKAPIMPKWAFGFWQSCERYKSQPEFIDVVREYRNRDFPPANIVLDWSFLPAMNDSVRNRKGQSYKGTCWDDLKTQIRKGLDYSLSGIPYWTFDIGGFCVEKRYENAKEGSADLDEWRELNTRWFQFGSFCPLIRSHGQYPYREIYNIAPEGHPAYKSMVYYDRLRYLLMPYIYSLAGLTYFNDYTIMRAMVMDFADDPAVREIGDQYMFGPSILVAPVYSYKARKREVYFPRASGWYDLYTGRYLNGGDRLEVDAPYERIPVFVKEGSIIPFGPAISYTDEKPADPVSLFIYAGRDCAFTMYEDEGVNYNYEKGLCSTIKFSYRESSGELTISDRNGEFPGMLKDRDFNLILVNRNNPVPFDMEVPNPRKVRYEGKKVVVKIR